MKRYLYILTAIIFLASCNNVEDPPVQNANRDYILINKTPNDHLKVYYSRGLNDCNSYQFLISLDHDQKVPFHVSPGETVYILYCTQTDIYCTGCRTLKIIGNTENNTSNVYLN